MRDIMHGGTHHITNLCNDNIRVLVLVCQLVPRGGKALTVSTPTHTVWWLCTVQENDLPRCIKLGKDRISIVDGVLPGLPGEL